MFSTQILKYFSIAQNPNKIFIAWTSQQTFSKLDLEYVTQEIPALSFILTLTFKTWTMPGLKCTQKILMPKSHRSKEQKIYKTRNLDLTEKNGSDETNRNMEQKDINENLKDFWTSPWNTNGYLVYKWIVENIFLENWSLDKSAFREFIFLQTNLGELTLSQGWIPTQGTLWHFIACPLTQPIILNWPWF